ncbi:DUF3616 domain-containing protein (plasmid) [Bradyrhizobium sp. 41S5]|uniref:DUF3616 domain-containing protein n=1 Tax=Bradyrhizobium sp. 41S5 TaxID=1404443 RepID=UPI001594E85C|nr:DUF3616 domain-containing protein [Bradyrhizobium sp. 41S5]UFX49423.1 DUF3616 domain-containing protein [Bradyrhizobium sp. 41S5]
MTFARMSRTCALLLGLVAAGWMQPAFGESGEAWPVKHKLLGKDGGKAKDVSGIACATAQGFPRSCLVIDDNVQDAQFVTVTDGELVAGSTVSLIGDNFEGEALELDGEGVAFAGDRYYVMGSHGHPRDKKGKLGAEEIKARISASSQIVRFRATGEDGTASEIERTPRLREIIRAEPLLAPFMDQRLENNGLTIEGVAIKDDLVLLAGFRGPVLDGNRAVVLSVRIDTLFGGSGTNHQVFRLPLGDGRGVRDLAVFESGILILAGPVENGPGAYAVYAWDGESENVRMLAELSSFDPERKPEGLLPLDRPPSGLRVLILFDSEKEGAPTPVEIEAP